MVVVCHPLGQLLFPPTVEGLTASRRGPQMNKVHTWGALLDEESGSPFLGGEVVCAFLRLPCLGDMWVGFETEAGSCGFSSLFTAKTRSTFPGMTSCIPDSFEGEIRTTTLSSGTDFWDLGGSVPASTWFA